MELKKIYSEISIPLKYAIEFKSFFLYFWTLMYLFLFFVILFIVLSLYSSTKIFSFQLEVFLAASAILDQPKCAGCRNLWCLKSG